MNQTSQLAFDPDLVNHYLINRLVFKKRILFNLS